MAPSVGDRLAIAEKAIPYLCGAMKDCTDDECINWRNRCMEVFPRALNPMVRDYRAPGAAKEHTNEIVVLDKRDIRNSNILIVRYIKPSAGTSMEILYAWTLGIPIVFWVDKDLTEDVSPWLRYHSTKIVHSYEDMVNTVCFYCETEV